MAAAAVCAAMSLMTLPASAGDEYAVSAPSGWAKTDGPAGVLGLWVQPNPPGFRQNINLISEPFDGSLDDDVAANRTALRAAEQSLRFGPESDVQTCVDHPAHFMAWEATMYGRDLLFEQVMSVWSGRAYVLTYTRQSGELELDAARAALTSLCIRPS